MCLLRRDFLLVAIGLVVPDKPDDVVNLDNQYDDPALGCPKCREVRFSHLEYLPTNGGLDIQCLSCWHVFDSDACFK